MAAHAVTYTVNSAADTDNGDCTISLCTLRDALNKAVSACGSDPAPVVRFAIPGTGPFTISAASAYPTLECSGLAFNPTIDGYSQPGSSPNSLATGFNANILIRIKQDPFYSGFNCGIESNDNGYGGRLAISGVELSDFNYGGFLPALCGPVTVTGSRFTNNVRPILPADNSLIGGASPAARNLISGNSGSGISVSSDNVRIINNYIGTDSSGNGALGNSNYGIETICANALLVENNVIGGNPSGGILLDGDNALIMGNKIGVGANGTAAVPNSSFGIHIGNFECGSSAARLLNNMIANNFGYGVTISDGVGHRVQNSSIHSNSDKNIDLDFFGGPLPNDTGDADTGPNSRQNHPVISNVTQSGGNTFVTWFLDSQPAVHTIEFFSNAGATGPAGRTPLAVFDSTDASGSFGTTTLIPGLHDFIAATATNESTGDTSEFSAVVAVTPTAGAAFSPTSLDFGGVPTGGTSVPKSATLTSTGGAPYVINLIESSGSCYGGPPAPPAMCSDAEFTCVTTCTPGTPYGQGQSCTFTATFSPTFLGFQSTTIHVCDNTSETPHTLALSGFGVAPPPLQLSPSSHSFGSVLVGTTSRSQLFRVSNPGTGPQEISGISTTSPEFGITSNNCPAEVPPEASCDVEVAFSPAAAGSVSGALVVQIQNNLVDAAVSSKAALGSSTISAALSGRGVVQAQGVLSMPTSVDVGTYTLGSPALETVVDLSNTGSSSIDLTSITVTDPFTLINECGPTLAAGASCRLRIGFSATTLGDFQGTLSVVTSATGGSRAIPVTARSQASPLPLVRVSPTAISFGERMAGTLSGAQRIVINNLGGAPASITTMLTGPHFQVTGTNCGPALAAQAECFVDVAFIPSAFGARNAQFIVGSNSAGSPHMVTLNGVGCRPFFSSAQRGTNSGPNCAP